MTTTTPVCWNCSYELTGMRVESRCPECGVDIWSQPKINPHLVKDAKNAMIWGIVALTTYFLCLGPLAGFVAIPAITIGSRVRRAVRENTFPPESASGANAGFWMGWSVVGLSLLWVLLIFVFLILGIGITAIAPGGPLSGP